MDLKKEEVQLQRFFLLLLRLSFRITKKGEPVCVVKGLSRHNRYAFIPRSP